MKYCVEGFCDVRVKPPGRAGIVHGTRDIRPVYRYLEEVPTPIGNMSSPGRPRP